MGVGAARKVGAEDVVVLMLEVVAPVVPGLAEAAAAAAAAAA